MPTFTIIALWPWRKLLDKSDRFTFPRSNNAKIVALRPCCPGLIPPRG